MFITVILIWKAIFPNWTAIASRRSKMIGDSCIMRGECFHLWLLLLKSPLIMQESPLILERQLAIAVQFGKIAFQFETTVLRTSVSLIITFSEFLVDYQLTACNTCLWVVFWNPLQHITQAPLYTVCKENAFTALKVKTQIASYKYSQACASLIDPALLQLLKATGHYRQQIILSSS